MPGTVTVLCYVTDYRMASGKNIYIADASGFMKSRSSNSPLKIFLKGFYSQNSTQKYSLPPFEKENVILATGKFRVVEYINEKNENLSALKVC